MTALYFVSVGLSWLVARAASRAAERDRGGVPCAEPQAPRRDARPGAAQREDARRGNERSRILRRRHRQQRHRRSGCCDGRDVQASGGSPAVALTADEVAASGSTRCSAAHEKSGRDPRRRAVLGGAVAHAGVGRGARAPSPAGRRSRSTPDDVRELADPLPRPALRSAPTASPTRSRCARSTGRRRSSSTSAPRRRSTASRAQGAYLGGVIAPGVMHVGRGAVPPRGAAAAGRARAARARRWGAPPRSRCSAGVHVGRRRAGGRAGAPPRARDEGNAACDCHRAVSPP